LLFSMAAAVILASTNLVLDGQPSQTSAYFTSSASAPSGTMSTVHLDVSTAPSVSGVFNIASNMLPGDFQIKTMDIVNNGPPGVAQQDFTYAVSSTSLGASNRCSLLDATDPPTCAHRAQPSATVTTGAALLLLRCTADAAQTTPSSCATSNVYVTQAYPLAGAGTRHQLAGGLTRSAISGVASGASYAISVGGTDFTGGPLVIEGLFPIGGPDAVAGADTQSAGLAAGRTDHLASIVYLPTQAGDSLADQASVVTFTWTATQRVGGTR